VVRILIDSGCETSIVKISVAIKFGKFKNAKPLRLEGIGGEKFSVNKTVKIALVDRHCDFDFYIVKDDFPIDHDMIIGSDYLTTHLCKIDYENQLLMIWAYQFQHIFYFEQEKGSNSLYTLFDSSWKEESKDRLLKMLRISKEKILENIENIELDDNIDLREDLESETSEIDEERDEIDWSCVGNNLDDNEIELPTDGNDINNNESHRYESVEELMEDEEYVNEVFTDFNYLENHANWLPELYHIDGRSLKIIKCNCDKEKGTVMVERIKLMPNLFMSDSFDSVKNGKINVLFCNVGDEEISFQLPKLKATEYKIVNEGKAESEDKTKRIYHMTKHELKERVEEIYKVLPKKHFENITEVANRVDRIVNDFAEVFHIEGDYLPELKDMEVEILLKNSEPVNVKQYRIPMHLKSELDKQIEENLRNGIIQPSYSPYNAPVLFVKKPDDPITKEPRWRLVVDFRQLNDQIVDDAYPLPSCEELLHNLHEATYFSTLDWYMGFYQQSISPEHRHVTAFSAAGKKYEYRRLPMGLKISPGSFQRNVNLIMSGLTTEQTLLFLDDILVKGKSLADHDKNLRLTLEKLRKYGVKMNTKKCILFTQELIFLGHKISPHGIFPDDRKIKAVMDWPRPKSIKEVQKFLGLVMYYKKFIPKYMEIASPLYELLRGKVQTYRWTDSQEKAFNDLKQKLIQPPILATPDPDPNNRFILTCDGSATGYGAVLSQVQQGKERPIAYFSKMVTENERRKLKDRAFWHEFRALEAACHEFRYFLRGGKKFLVRTDSRTLAQMKLKKNEGKGEFPKWNFALIDYDFDIKYIPAGKLRHADALSRMYRVRTRGEINRALQECHDGPVGGHRSTQETLKKLKDKGILWDTMAVDTKRYCTTCDDCQRAKVSKYIKQPLVFTDTQSRPWEKISMDVVGQIHPPSSEGHKYILTIRDIFTKFTMAYPMRTQSAEETAKNLMKFITSFGCPESLQTDRGQNFVSKLITNLCKVFGVKKIENTAFRPQSSASIERFHRDFKVLLHLYTSNVKDWHEVIDLVCFALNTSKCRSTNYTPFELVYCRSPNIPSSFRQKPTDKIYNPDDYVKIMKTNLQTAYQAVHNNLLKSKEEIKRNYDKRLNNVQLKVGDKVLLKNDDKKLTKDKKFPFKWEGPYEILHDNSNNTFKLKIGRRTVTKHGDVLKKYNERHDI